MISIDFDFIGFDKMFQEGIRTDGLGILHDIGNCPLFGHLTNGSDSMGLLILSESRTCTEHG